MNLKGVGTLSDYHQAFCHACNIGSPATYACLAFVRRQDRVSSSPPAQRSRRKLSKSDRLDCTMSRLFLLPILSKLNDGSPARRELLFNRLQITTTPLLRFFLSRAFVVTCIPQ
jgi:hypothetical protein